MASDQDMDDYINRLAEWNAATRASVLEEAARLAAVRERSEWLGKQAKGVELMLAKADAATGMDQVYELHRIATWSAKVRAAEPLAAETLTEPPGNGDLRGIDHDVFLAWWSTERDRCVRFHRIALAEVKRLNADQ